MSKLLDLGKENKKLITYLMVALFAFVSMIILFVNRGTYSVIDEDSDGLEIDCSETASIGGELECSIVLNSVTMITQGISAKYTVPEGMEFVEFVAEDTWEVSASDEDGFVLLNLNGVSGSVAVGTVKYMIPTTAMANDIYKIELTDATIGDGEEGKITFENVYDEVRILSDVNTLDNIIISNGTLNEIFDKDINNYTVTTDSDKITIEVYKTDEKANVSGDVGELELHYGTNSFEIIVTSEDGTVNIYKVNVFREYKLENTIYTYSEEDNFIYTGNDVDEATILSNVLISDELSKTIDNNKLAISYDGEKLLELNVLNFAMDDYKVENMIVYLDADLTVNEFDNVITLSEGLTYKIFNGSEEVTDGNLLGGMILKIYYDNTEVDLYIISVTAYNLSFDSNLEVDEENKYIKYLTQGMTISEFVSNINVVGGNAVVYPNSKYETAKEDNDIVATGDILVVYSNNEIKNEYTLSVLGDANGDGEVNSIDLVQIRKHIVGWINPNTGEIYEKTGVYYYGIDMNKDGEVNSIDLVRMRKRIVGIG